ncbi:MAG: PKD domain-containing protein [Methanimicrococcus sp.]|nr:PKD domain-containing protein [Methanimicrococcus sp.]
MKMIKNRIGKYAAAAVVLCMLFALFPAPVLSASDGYIEVGTIPVPNFRGDPLRGSAPLAVAFTDLSAGARTNMTYLWDFGDGNTSTTAGNVTHTYTREGNYTVKLTLKNDFGTVTETKTNYVYVGSGPVANFTASTNVGPAPLNVRFNDTSTGNPTSWLWDFGDGNTSTARNPTHTYNSTGNYTVSLTVSNDFGRDTKTQTSFIRVGFQPYVYFTANGTVNSKQVAFTTHGHAPESATYSWNFGDGSSSAERNPTHTYRAIGVYNVTLTVTDTFGTSNYTLRNVSITDALKADFTATNNFGSSPLTARFTDATVGSSTNATYLWNFGDGSTSSERNPTHTYRNVGQYTVALTVTHPCGATDSVVKAGFVSVGNAPVVDFVGTPTSGIAPHAVQFTDRSQGTNLTYFWEFGDGGTSTAKDPRYTYNQTGTYSVKLTVNSSFGNNSVTKTNYIYVGNVPRADFQADVLSGIAPHPVQFTDLSRGNPTTWFWDFGDGNTSTLQNPRHTYRDSGYYNVSLKVTNAYGESTLFRGGNGEKVWAEDQKVSDTPTPLAPPETPPAPAEPPAPEPEEPKSSSSIIWILLIIVVLVLVAAGAYLFMKKKK